MTEQYGIRQFYNLPNAIYNLINTIGKGDVKETEKRLRPIATPLETIAIMGVVGIANAGNRTATLTTSGGSECSGGCGGE